MSLADKILDRARFVKVAIVYWLLVVMVALALAVRLGRPTGSLFVDIGLWAVAIPSVLAGVIWLAGRVRARVVDVEARRIWTLEDALIGQAAVVGGALLLAWYLPRTLHGGGGWDLGLTVAGGSFVSAAATMLVRYAFQR